ncbi:ITIH5 [Scenedesmus sp. PABB004]|nr:ITIH5 [Scenedesmus sp. PABB004]
MSGAPRSGPYAINGSGAAFPKIYGADGAPDGDGRGAPLSSAMGSGYPAPMYGLNGGAGGAGGYPPAGATPGSGWSSSTGGPPGSGLPGGSTCTSGSVPLPGGAGPPGGSSGGGSLQQPGLSAGPPASYPYAGALGGGAGGGGGGVPMSAPGVLGYAPSAPSSGPTYGSSYISASGGPPNPAARPAAASLAAAALAGVASSKASALGGLPLHGGGLAPPTSRPQLGDDLFCSCPMVCVVGTNAGAPHAVPLTIMSLRFDVSCHISQAFVDAQLVCQYPASWNDAPLVFFLPKTADTTITELAIENMVRPSVFATAVVPVDDVKRFAGKGGAGGGPNNAVGEPEDGSGPDPELLMLPLPPGMPGDQYRVKLSFFLPMAFDVAQGRYVLRLPTTVPPVCLAQGASVNSVLDVSVTINTGNGEEVDLLVPSHPTAIMDSQRGSIAFELDNSQPWDNGDFIAGYSVWRDSMTATVHVEPPQPGLPDQRGTFALSITPPGPEHSVRFPRSVVFMFDRSGSMTGDPIRYAKAALLNGLHMLGPEDRFTVVAFDHEQLWWTDRLIEATPENVVTCMHWVNDDLSARGTTDIHGPLARALKLLSGAPGLPLVFLLTDGCVEDERDICSMAEAAIAAAGRPGDANNGLGAAPLGSALGGPPPSSGSAVSAVHSVPPPPAAPPALAPRVFTFGIGPYCNHYFLKRLAALGRGMAGLAFRPHAIQAGMEAMLAAAALPMLSDVHIRVEGLTSVELYPFPIPDVFVGCPLLVSGKFEGDWPESVEIAGTLPDGTSWCQEVPTLAAGELPLQKIFAKSQLDLMTANAWMAGDPPAMVRAIVDLSVASGVASAHTAMVGFETTPERYEQMQAVPPSERRKKIIKWAIGGAAGVGLVAGVAAALTFGDLAGTIGNLPVGDAMGALGGDLGGFFESLGGGMDCCGGCDCGDCGDACGSCLTC